MKAKYGCKRNVLLVQSQKIYKKVLLPSSETTITYSYIMKEMF